MFRKATEGKVYSTPLTNERISDTPILEVTAVSGAIASSSEINSGNGRTDGLVWPI